MHDAGENVCCCGRIASPGQTQQRWGGTWGLCDDCTRDRENDRENGL